MSLHHCNTVAAKTNLNKMIEQVLLGDEFTIERRGKPVARLLAINPLSTSTEDNLNLMSELHQFHKSVAKKSAKKTSSVALARSLRSES